MSLRTAAIPKGVERRAFPYHLADLEAWIASHGKWRTTHDPRAWGPFQELTASERYLFTFRDGQPRYHFGETWVGAALEREGYRCWTTARLIRRRRVRTYEKQTAEVEALLKKTLSRVPNEEYQKLRESEGLHLKTIDLVGYAKRRDHWVFCEVKRKGDRLMPEQIETLRFLRKLYPVSRADVLVADVAEGS